MRAKAAAGSRVVASASAPAVTASTFASSEKLGPWFSDCGHRCAWLHNGVTPTVWVDFCKNGHVVTSFGQRGCGNRWLRVGGHIQAIFGRSHHLLQLKGDCPIGRPTFQVIGRRMRNGGSMRDRRPRSFVVT